MKHLLLPVSWLYGLGMTCRNKAFDSGLFRSIDVGVPVISVGNMVMGGTGKTPLVEYIVDICLEKSRRVAVVSRGYKRVSRGVVTVSDGRTLLADARTGGDEPVQIARRHPKAIVVVGEQRVAAAQTAVNRFSADLIVMDDGFQHRSLHRTLDIVVLDSRKDLFLTHMIPAGARREPIKAISRARLLALSRADQDTGWWRGRREISGMPAVHYRYKIDRIMEMRPDDERPAIGWQEKQLFLFSGIGDHMGFVQQMKTSGAHVVGDLRFPDHHAFSSQDLKAIADSATDRGATALLTTEKDAVRLLGNGTAFSETLQHFPLFSVGIAVDVTEGKELLYSMIDECLAGGAV